jgi:hypothetical protein
MIQRDGAAHRPLDLQDFTRLLEQCRASFGPVGPGGRRFTVHDMAKYLHVMKPGWCEDSDPLSELFRGYRRLLASGAVTWGCMVQANERLFKDGPLDHPAELVYAADLGSQARFPELALASSRIFDLKGESVDDPELQAVGDHLANEMTRTFGQPVPEKLSPGLRCETTTVYVVRRHLPRRWLCGPLMPIVVAPEPPRLAMVLPAHYWPPELARWWAAGCERQG